MEVSLTNNAPTLRSTGLNVNICGIRSNTYPANNLWEIDLSLGALEKGSSGGPFLDPSGRVIGQVTAGTPSCNSNTKFGGAFHVSWTGGGTSATRLSDWLAPSGTGVTTTNEITALPSASGPNFFCNNATYTLNNVPSGASVSWSVNPSWAVSPSSGTGNIANLTRAGNANATITFRIGCDNGAPFVVNFHVGDYGSSDYPVFGPSNAGCNQTVYYQTNELPGATSYNWFWPSGWTYVSGQGTRYLTLQTGSSGGVVGVQVNACTGGGSPATLFTSINCFGRLAADVFPNPASEQVEIVGGREVPGEGGTRSAVVPETGSYDARLYNAMGNLVRSGRSTNGKLSFNVQQLPDGVYTLRLDDGTGKPVTKRVVVAH